MKKCIFATLVVMIFAGSITEKVHARSWDITNSIDQMTGKSTRLASIDAEEQLQFGFPYSGGSTATLTLRKHPSRGISVLLSVDKGHFLCHDCTVKIKFDDGKPITLSAETPADHRTTILFLEPPGKIINGLKKSKITLVEAMFYQHGVKVMRFNTAGLEWK